MHGTSLASLAAAPDSRAVGAGWMNPGSSVTDNSSRETEVWPEPDQHVSLGRMDQGRREYATHENESGAAGER
jgi:hypothetical protein